MVVLLHYQNYDCLNGDRERNQPDWFIISEVRFAYKYNLNLWKLFVFHWILPYAGHVLLI